MRDCSHYLISKLREMRCEKAPVLFLTPPFLFLLFYPFGSAGKDISENRKNYIITKQDIEEDKSLPQSVCLLSVSHCPLQHKLGITTAPNHGDERVSPTKRKQLLFTDIVSMVLAFSQGLLCFGAQRSHSNCGCGRISALINSISAKRVVLLPGQRPSGGHLLT